MALRAISSRPDNYGRREQSPFATSPAYDLLFHELTRYLANEIRGRSFLIAGHRGSGKTTLVLRAIEDLQGYWQEELVGSGSRTTTSLQRPLLVKLHGPNLLRGLALDHRTDASDKNKKQEQVDREQDLTQKILVQIIISLYRALSAEVSRCYLAHIRHNPPRGASPELAGQLSLELDNAPDPAVLREFWTRVKALGGGVLFYDVSPPFGQGTLELVAISTAAQAYRVVSGAVTYKSSESGAAETDKSLSTEAKPQFKDLGQNILSLLTGGFSARPTSVTGAILIL